MFTGIITAVGRIAQVRDLGASSAHGKQLAIEAPAGYLDDVGLGDSIAINGACMTATAVDAAAGRFAIDVSAESLARTAGLDHAGPVNLEKALRLSDRLGGHLVSGHVDGVGEVVNFDAIGDNRLLTIRAPGALARYIARKGSITVDGVSLTTNAIQDSEFSINLIPHTLENTTLHRLQPGSKVNLEVDLIARYCERLLNPEN